MKNPFFLLAALVLSLGAAFFLYGSVVLFVNGRRNGDVGEMSNAVIYGGVLVIVLLLAAGVVFHYA